MAKSKTLDLTDDQSQAGSFVIDFGEIAGFEPVPEGVYDAEIVQAIPGMSKSNNPKITLQWRVLSGDEENRRIFQDLSFHPKALFATKAVLIGLGFDSNFQGEIDPEELIGLNAELVVAVETSDVINPQTNEPYPPRNVVKKVTSGASGVSDLL